MEQNPVADFVFNSVHGKVAQYYQNVHDASPSNSAIVVVLCKSSGLEADATLKAYTDLASLLAGTTDELTDASYSRKSVTGSSNVTLSLSGTTGTLDLPDQTWTSLAGAATGKLLICYDNDTTSGTDSNIVPLSAHDFAVTPDGTNVTATISNTVSIT